MAFLTLIIISIITFFVAIFFKIKRAYKYFENRNAPYIKPTFFFGSTAKVFTFQVSIEDNVDKIYKQLKGSKIGGFFQFWTPAWLVIDPDLAEKILIKDFTHFQDHQGELDLERNPLDGNLFNLKGQQWKTMRTKLSPIFSSGKLKWMINQVLICGDNLIERLNKISKKDIPIKDPLQSYGLDVIGSCAFGIDIKSFNDPNSKFSQMVHKMMNPSRLVFMGFVLKFFFPKLVRLLNLRTVPKDVSEFFLNISKYSIEERIKGSVTRNDFVQLLAELKEKGTVELDNKSSNELNDNDKSFEFTDEALAAQTFIFFVAGLDTTSTMTMYTLYLLSKHPEIQDKIRDEIKKNIKNEITYDDLTKMTYLDCCISEALRMFPPAIMLVRECTKSYTVDNITISKGDSVIIPARSFHMDPDYFPDPDKFIPERFLDSKYSLRQGCGLYLPFGDGPRVCIARRFAVIMAKSAIVKILQNYKLVKSAKNIEPLVRDKASITHQPVGGLHISLEPIQK